MKISLVFLTLGSCLNNLLSKKGYEYDLKFEWITKKIPMVGSLDTEEEKPDYKKKLQDIFKS